MNNRTLCILTTAFLMLTIQSIQAQPGNFGRMRGRGGSILRADFQVQPVIETEPPIGAVTDSSDDTCIWIHPDDPNLSLIIGQSKDTQRGGVYVYDLSGRRLQFLEDGNSNNVDLRYNFPLNGELVDIVAASNRAYNTINVYKVIPAERKLENIGQIESGYSVQIYGLCMYHSLITDDFYVITNFLDGNVQQWLLNDNQSGKVSGTKVREFDVGGQTEGCVADDEYARLYIGEENIGLWQYGAEPNDGTTRRSVDQAGGHIAPGIEGITIYYAGNGEGYLIVSDQNSSRFAIYNRQGNNEYISSFEIVSNDQLGIDGCTQSDGVEVANSLGSKFPNGLFIAHDGNNTGGNAGNTNYKFVPWDSIANAVTPPLTIDTSWNPRIQKQISDVTESN